VGRQGFVENVQALLGTKTTNREITKIVGKHALREQSALYDSGLGAENVDLRLDNSFLNDL
jgi:hypothetical protein